MTDVADSKCLAPSVLLDVCEAGNFLGLTRWQIRGLIASHELPVVRVGRKFYLRRASLVRWAERAEATKGLR
jgi:excisionase family DNA binding protein